jgi:cell wall-associated NlpC family hydrolase
VRPRGVAYVPTLAAWLKGTGRTVTEPRAGDLVIYDWDGGVPDHAGIVIGLAGDVLHTVEGNTGIGSDANGGEVMRRQRRRAQASSFGRV